MPEFSELQDLAGRAKTLALTAMYRNHFYIEKLLGNLVGLGRLMSFVARESGLRLAHSPLSPPMLRSTSRTVLAAQTSKR